MQEIEYLELNRITIISLGIAGGYLLYKKVIHSASQNAVDRFMLIVVTTITVAV